MKADIDVTVSYPHPVERVWEALTSSEALAAWLTLAQLTARGVSFNESEVQQAPWGRWKTFDDPDGNGWVLQQSNPDFRG